MKDSLYVFPDTNIFLHYPPLSQIDWRTLCDSTIVQLVICLQVIHELDEKKSDSRLADRALRAIKEIRTASDTGQPLREGVTLSIFDQELRQSDFPATLSPESGDDRIVHLALMYRDQNPGQEVAIATEDYGMELRCKATGVSVVRMDTAMRLQNPQDALTTKYRQAITELNTLKNRFPRLSLWISAVGKSPSSDEESVFELHNTWQSINIERELTKIREQYPKQAGLHAYGRQIGAIPSIAGAFVSQGDWQQYDHKLDEFYIEYQEYLDYQNTVGAARARSVVFTLWLCNDGKGLATDIDVVVRFPTSIRWCAKSGSKEAEPIEKEMEPPSPPKEPQPSWLALQQRLADWTPVASSFRDPHIAHLDEWTPDTSVAKRDDELFEIHARLSKLKHGHNVSLGTFLAVFSSWEDVKPFQVSFTISTSALIEKTTGTLSVKAKQAGQDS